MPTSPPDGFVIDSVFTDFKAFQEALTGWKLDLRQLECGRPSIRMVLAAHGGVQLGYLACDKRYERWTASPRGMRTFALLADSTTAVSLGAERMDDRSLLCFPRNDAVVVVSGPDFRVFTLTVPESLLVERSEALGYPEIFELLGGRGGHFRISGTALEPLRARLRIPSVHPGKIEGNRMIRTYALTGRCLLWSG